MAIAVPFQVFLFQFCLAILLFFVLNWIGRSAYSLGYLEISLFSKVDEAPALNFLLRVLTPIVYLVLVSTLLYSFHLDVLTDNIFMVSVYYIVFRLAFNLMTGRGRLLNWKQQILYWIPIVILSTFVYDKFISTKQTLIPDFKTSVNELWVVIALFLFQISNKSQFRSKSSEERHLSYLGARVKQLQRKYGAIVDQKISNDRLKGLVYAIMIYESFNRPRIIRWAEWLFSHIGKAKTLGIMQVRTDQPIGDRESVIIGIDKLVSDYTEIMRQDNPREWKVESELVERYNAGSGYKDEIDRIWTFVMIQAFPNSPDRLVQQEAMTPEINVP